MAHPPGPLIPFTFGLELEFVFAIDDRILGPPERKPHRDNNNYLLSETVAYVLEKRDLHVHVAKDHGNRFSMWQITYDCSAHPYEQGDGLARLFPDHIVKIQAHNWRAEGLELLSRIFPVPTLCERGMTYDPCLQEISTYLDGLRSKPADRWLAKTTADCGFHVHIGVPPRNTAFPSLPLDVLQHLAFILFQYEDVISDLHHPQRRGYADEKASEYIGTNKAGILGHDHICGRRRFPNTVELTDIQNKIFARNMTVKKLAMLMGGNGQPLDEARMSDSLYEPDSRFKFVNWTNLYRYQKLGTVEFRQHHGTLNFEDISRWVCFLTSLMRTAERRAREATPLPSPTRPATPRSQLTWAMREGGKYRFRSRDLEEKTIEFFDLLGLDRNARIYWVRRWEGYNPNLFTDMPLRELCRACSDVGLLAGSDSSSSGEEVGNFEEHSTSEEEEEEGWILTGGRRRGEKRASDADGGGEEGKKGGGKQAKKG